MERIPTIVLGDDLVTKLLEWQEMEDDEKTKVYIEVMDLIPQDHPILSCEMGKLSLFFQILETVCTPPRRQAMSLN